MPVPGTCAFIALKGPRHRIKGQDAQWEILRSLPIAITVTLNHQGREYLVVFDYDKV